MKQNKNYSKWHPKYWGVYPLLAIVWVFAHLPFRMRFHFGRGLGYLYYACARKDKRIAMINLSLCMPHLSLKERKHLCLQSFLNLAASVIETPFMRLSDKTPIDRMVASIEGYEHIIAAKQKGQGVIILFPHLTAIFYVGYLCWRITGEHFGFMYRPSKNPLLAKQFIKQFNRESTAFTRRNAKQMTSFLRSGGAVWYSPDLVPRKQDRLYVPFLGVNAATGTAPMRFAEMSGAAVVAIGFKRDSAGRFYIRFSDVMTNFPSEDSIQDATRVNALMDKQILAFPEGYLWLYRRFNKPPKGEPNPYNKSVNSFT